MSFFTARSGHDPVLEALRGGLTRVVLGRGLGRILGVVVRSAERLEDGGRIGLGDLEELREPVVAEACELRAKSMRGLLARLGLVASLER